MVTDVTTLFYFDVETNSFTKVAEPTEAHDQYYSFDVSTGTFQEFTEPTSSVDLYIFDSMSNSYVSIPETNPYISEYYTYSPETLSYVPYIPTAAPTCED